MVFFRSFYWLLKNVQTDLRHRRDLSCSSLSIRHAPKQQADGSGSRQQAGRQQAGRWRDPACCFIQISYLSFHFVVELLVHCLPACITFSCHRFEALSLSIKVKHQRCRTFLTICSRPYWFHPPSTVTCLRSVRPETHCLSFPSATFLCSITTWSTCSTVVFASCSMNVGHSTRRNE